MTINSALRDAYAFHRQWLTPSGKSISDGGLKADISATRTQEDVTAGKDPQKARAVEYLTTGK